MILNFDAECQRTNQVQEENEVLRQKVGSERTWPWEGLLLSRLKLGSGSGGWVKYRTALLSEGVSQKTRVGTCGLQQSENQRRGSHFKS